MRAFTNDPALVQVGKEALRYCIFGLPLAGFQIMGGGLFQALGKPIPAVILSLSRQVLILIPLMALLPRFIGIKGVWLSFPTADTLSFVLALSFILWAMRRLLPAPEVSEAPIETSRVPRGHFSSSG